MKYCVTITEKLERSVVVEANSVEEAGTIVLIQYSDGEHVLDYDDFVEVNFNVCPEVKE